MVPCLLPQHKEEPAGIWQIVLCDKWEGNCTRSETAAHRGRGECLGTSGAQAMRQLECGENSSYKI